MDGARRHSAGRPMERGGHTHTLVERQPGPRGWTARCAALAAATLLIGSAAWWWSAATSPSRSGGPLPHEVYIWQRQWTDDVRVNAARAVAFGGLVVWAAEVDWRDGAPRVARGAVDYAALAAAGRPVGLALRIGPFAGPFSETDETATLLVALAADVIRSAEDAGVTVHELQLDFDCATARLDGYCRWVRAIRRRVGPLPVTITALPTWLGNNAFRALAAEADGFVLQVHSLERPPGPDAPLTLCDPAAARRAVERAGRVGRPFRVALATYGYGVGFAADGRLLGLQAEGPAPAWPDDAHVRVVRADPDATAALVRGWAANRPAHLRGLIWYRMSTGADTLNWRWPTLEAVARGEAPRGAVRVQHTAPAAPLVELTFENTGAADANLPNTVVVTWHESRLLAADGVGGYACATGATEVRFRRTVEARAEPLPPDGQRAFGWLRFDRNTEVTVHVTPSND